MNRRQMSSTAINQTNEVDPAPIFFLSEIFQMYLCILLGVRDTNLPSAWDYLIFPTLQAVQRLRRKKKKTKTNPPPIPISAAAPIICYSEIIIIRQHTVCLYLEGKVFFQSVSSWVRKKQMNYWSSEMLNCSALHENNLQIKTIVIKQTNGLCC